MPDAEHPAAKRVGSLTAPRSQSAYVGALLGAVALMSLAPVLVRVSDQPFARSALLRCAYSLPVVVVLVLLRHGSLRQVSRRFSWTWRDFVAGTLLGGCMASFHAAVDGVGAGLATVVGNLHLVLIPLLVMLFFREPPPRLYWLAVLLVGAGVVALAGVATPPDSGGPGVQGGVVLGVGSAAMMSGFLLMTSRTAVARSLPDAIDATAVVMAGATVTTLVCALAAGVAGPAPTWQGNAWLLLLALGPQIGGFVLLSVATGRLPVTVASASMLLVPVLALAWSRLFLGEPLGPPQLAGAGLVLAGVVLAHVTGSPSARRTERLGPAAAPGQ